MHLLPDPAIGPSLDSGSTPYIDPSAKRGVQRDNACVTNVIKIETTLDLKRQRALQMEHSSNVVQDWRRRLPPRKDTQHRQV